MPKVFKYETPYDTYDVVLKCGQYSNGRLAIQLVSPFGEPIATATVNIPEAKLAPGEILIKTWSENEKMLPFLEKNGIVRPTGRAIPAGYATAAVCEFLQIEDCSSN